MSIVLSPAGAMAIRRGLSKPLAAAAGPRRSIWFRLTPSSSPANISTPRFRAASRRSVSTPILLVESPHRSRAIWDRQPRIKRFLWICSVPRRNPQRLPMRPRCAGTWMPSKACLFSRRSPVGFPPRATNGALPSSPSAIWQIRALLAPC